MVCTFSPIFSAIIYFNHLINCLRIISGTIMTISKDRVKPSPLPDSWKLAEIFTTGVVLGSYLAMMTVIFFWAAYKTDFFPVHTHHSVCLDKVLSVKKKHHITFLCMTSVHLAYQHSRKPLMMTSGSLLLRYISKSAQSAKP